MGSDQSMVERVNPYLLVGLSMAVGAVFGYAACLWRWCSAEEARTKAADDLQASRAAFDQSEGLRQSVTLTNLPELPPGATDMLINGKPLSSFYRPPTTFRHGHDCRAEACTDLQGRSRH